MPLDLDDLYDDLGFKFRGDPVYKEQMERLVRDLPEPRILTCADIPRIHFSDPPKYTIWEEIEAWQECIAKGGRPG